jgi:8-oxo-dGTP pyrophosphatase MutT (NUDIX family)
MKPGETPEEAARREMAEELGKPPGALAFAYQYLWRSPIETELVRTFATMDEGPFRLDPEEVDDGRLWSFADIEAHLADSIFTPQFVQEFPRMKAFVPKVEGARVETVSIREGRNS